MQSIMTFPARHSSLLTITTVAIVTVVLPPPQPKQPTTMTAIWPARLRS